MKKTIVLFIISLIINPIFAKKNKDFMSLNLGVRETTLKFKTKGQQTDSINELNTKRLKSQQLGIKLTFKEKKYFLKLQTNYGKQTNTEGQLLDLSILYGKYKIYSSYFKSSFAFGYGQNTQNLNFINNNIKSNYQTKWLGPKLEFSLDYRRNRQILSLIYDYQYSDFDGQLETNTIKVIQTGKAHNHKLTANYERALSKNNSFSFSLSHYDYQLIAGKSQTNTSSKQDLDSASLNSNELKITYHFLF
jgi:hypothetical protein